MTSPSANQTSAHLEATFGLGRGWTSQAGQSATVWETPAYHLLWFDDAASDVELRFIFTDFTENAVSPAYRRQVLEKFEGL